MNLSLTKIIWSFFFIFLIFITGVILTKTGKPYNLVLQTLHKLSSVVFFIIIAITYVSLLKNNNILLTCHIFMFLTLLFFVLSFISGVLVLSLKNVNVYILYSHRILPFLSFIFGVFTYILIILKK
jgi:hypothetical protein